LRGIEDVCPGAAGEIIAEAMRNGAHRRSLEVDMLRGSETRANRGQWMALAVTFGGFATSTVLAIVGAPGVGGVLAGGTLLGLVGIFAYGSAQQKHEREAALNQMGGEVSRARSE
jgi:uncharacterized membrane protein